MEEVEVVKGLHKELTQLLKSKDFTSLTHKHQKFAISNAIVAIKQAIRLYKL